MIELENVSVTRGAFALDGIICRIEKGRLTCILGENGSGKTTLLRCMAGLLKSSGSVRLGGRSISSMTARERAGELALLPQTLPDTPLTVREFVSLARIPHTGIWGYLGAHDHRAVNEALEMLNLTQLADRRVSSLSGGEKRRASIAQVLAQGAECILLDEPTASLDLRARKETWHLAARLTRELGKTVVLVTHDINEALSLSDRILIMAGGILRFSGTREECLNTTVIEDTFGAERLISEGRTVFE